MAVGVLAENVVAALAAETDRAGAQGAISDALAALDRIEACFQQGLAAARASLTAAAQLLDHKGESCGDGASLIASTG